MDSVEVTVTHISGRRAGECLTCTVPATIGRAPINTIQLATHDTRASAKHAELQLEGAQVYLQDLNSTNGTFLRGRRVTRAKLTNGDVVEFGIGGPQLRFEFAVKANQPSALPPSVSPIPPTQIAVAFQIPMSDVPQPTIPNVPITQQTPTPEIAPAPGLSSPAPMVDNANSNNSPAALQPSPMGDDWAGNAPSQTTHLGTREFPLKSRIGYIYYGIGALLVLTGIIFSFNKLLILMLPTVLLGFFLLLTGWSCSRVNITITAEGIEYQGVFRQFSIPWSEVTELHAERSQTRILTHLVYTVKSPKKTITFTTSGFREGLELAQLLSRRTGRRWE